MTQETAKSADRALWQGDAEKQRAFLQRRARLAREDAVSDPTAPSPCAHRDAMLARDKQERGRR